MPKTSELNLDSQIEARKQEAEHKMISGKACLVARHLGTHCNIDDRRQKTEGSEYTFQSPHLLIVWRFGSGTSSDGDWGFNSLEITHRDKKVFDTSGSRLESYIPGPWEKQLDSLYNQAKTAETKHQADQRKVQATQRRADEDKARQKWGL